MFLQLSKSKVAALNYLLQLSGRLQLVMAQVGYFNSKRNLVHYIFLHESLSVLTFYQIEKADNKKAPALTLEGQMDESEDDEVDEVMYGRDVESQTSSDGDD